VAAAADRYLAACNGHLAHACYNLGYIYEHGSAALLGHATHHSAAVAAAAADAGVSSSSGAQAGHTAGGGTGVPSGSGGDAGIGAGSTLPFRRKLNLGGAAAAVGAAAAGGGVSRPPLHLQHQLPPQGGHHGSDAAAGSASTPPTGAVEDVAAGLLPPDPHLAKRYYDLALEKQLQSMGLSVGTGPGAERGGGGVAGGAGGKHAFSGVAVPVKLALWRMALLRQWERVRDSHLRPLADRLGVRLAFERALLWAAGDETAAAALAELRLQRERQAAWSGAGPAPPEAAAEAGAEGEAEEEEGDPRAHIGEQRVGHRAQQQLQQQQRSAPHLAGSDGDAPLGSDSGSESAAAGSGDGSGAGEEGPAATAEQGGDYGVAEAEAAPGGGAEVSALSRRQQALLDARQRRARRRSEENVLKGALHAALDALRSLLQPLREAWETAGRWVRMALGLPATPTPPTAPSAAQAASAGRRGASASAGSGSGAAGGRGDGRGGATAAGSHARLQQQQHQHQHRVVVAGDDGGEDEGGPLGVLLDAAEGVFDAVLAPAFNALSRTAASATARSAARRGGGKQRTGGSTSVGQHQRQHNISPAPADAYGWSREEKAFALFATAVVAIVLWDTVVNRLYRRAQQAPGPQAPGLDAAPLGARQAPQPQGPRGVNAPGQGQPPQQPPQQPGAAQ
jgi:hypothetical protein